MIKATKKYVWNTPPSYRCFKRKFAQVGLRRRFRTAMSYSPFQYKLSEASDAGRRLRAAQGKLTKAERRARNRR